MNSDAKPSIAISIIRSVLGVIFGYSVMVVVVVLGMYVTWMILGAEGAFEGESTIASSSWSAICCVFGLIAAFLGGMVAGLVGHHKKVTVFSLAAIVLIFGLVVAVMLSNTEVLPFPDGKEIADLTFAEAGEVARSPDWYNYVIPLIGAFGILAGGHLVAAKNRV